MAQLDYDEVRLGTRLREARLGTQVSLRALANQVGISPSGLSQIETGKAKPSITTLRALATQLELSLDELLGVSERDDNSAGTLGAPTSVDELVVRRGDRRALELATGVRWERLTPDSDPLIEFLHVTYAPGARSIGHGRRVQFAGTQYGLVLTGQLDVTVGDDTCRLGAGDAISFPSTNPHVVANRSTREATGIWLLVRQP
jgi:transcriptional regulator with XRE-family HTH domain